MFGRLAHRWLDDDQIIIVLFGSHAGMAAFLLGWEAYVTDAGRFFWPHVWPWVFLAAWVSCIAYHARRGSRRLWKQSGRLLLAAYLSRAAALLLGMVDEGWTARVTLGVATWGVMAAAVWLIWLRGVVPAQDEP